MRHIAWLLIAVSAQLAPASASAASEQDACSERRSFWKRVGRSGVQEYCRLVNRARANLWSRPEQSRKFALAAAKLQKPGTLARVVAAHAALLMGQPSLAHEEFSRAVPELNDPATMRTLGPSAVLGGARAALLSADYEVALQRYRWVLLRLVAFSSPREEARILIEAATAATYAGPDHGREARAHFATAASKNAPLLRPLAEAAWVLSFHREGQNARAKSRARKFEDSWSVLWPFENQRPPRGAQGETLPVLPPGEHFAMAVAVAHYVEPDAEEIHQAAFDEATGDTLPVHLKK